MSPAQAPKAAPSSGRVARFLAARWLVWLLGAVLGLASQVIWLMGHEWEGAAVRLPAGALGGALLVWGLAEGAHWLLRRSYKSLWRPLEPVGLAVARGAWQLSGLADWRGRRGWIAALLVLALAAGAGWWWCVSRPAKGGLALRELFAAHALHGGHGLRAVLRPGLDGQGPAMDLGVLAQFNYPHLASLAGAREYDYRLHLLGLITVEKAGWYRFAGVVDDGLELLVDGRAAFSRLDISATRRLEGRLWLAPGPHALEITYVQYRGAAVLKVLWQPPDGPEEPLPSLRLTPLREGFPLARAQRLRLAYGLASWPGSTYNPWDAGRHWRLPW